MIQSWKLRLASLVMSGAIALSADCAFAQITPNTTLGNENSKVTSIGKVDAINGGATRGANLLHSFQEFNVGEGRSTYFINPVGIENILSRVTGGKPSQILGKLGVLGNANLFLINPNGIIFGQNASLDVRGSFVGTTANGIGLTNGDIFSTNPQAPLPTKLLNVNPNALLFNQIRAAKIENSSVVDAGLNPSSIFTARGLRVPNGKSLLLVGGDININGGGLFAFGGRVELGGFSGAGTIGLNGQGNNLSLSFPNSVERSNVSLSNGAFVDVAAGDGGSIAVNARNLEMTRRSYLRAGISIQLGSDQSKAGNIDINATGTINLNQSSIVNDVRREASGQGGDVNISASKLLLEGGSQVSAATFGSGKGGSLRVDATDVQLIGISADSPFPSFLSTTAQPNSTGDAGDLTIKTNSLLVKHGAQVGAATSGSGKGGNLRVDAQDVQLIGRSADGQAASGLYASTQLNSTGDAGSLTIKTDTLLLQDGSGASVQSVGTGTSGNLTVNARSIHLNNNALITASTRSAKVNLNSEQATININSQDLIMRRNSNIFTNARGENAIGGNINIDTDFLIALENSDISANSANFRGGRVNINASGIFGTKFRDARTPESDITATGASPEFSGTVNINTLGIEPNSGLINLPTQLVEAIIAQTCQPSPNQAQSEFVVTGRGGLPPNPGDALSTDAVQVGLVTLNPEVAQPSTQVVSTNPISSTPAPIVEATGWIIDADGNLVLTANAPTLTPHSSSWQSSADCRAFNQYPGG